MKTEEVFIKGLLLIYPDVFSDDRGEFHESFSKKKYEDIGIPYDFVQDNESVSEYGVIRGLHFQTGEYTQGKLVRVVKGEVLDVAVDLRPGSSTYGKHYSVIINSKNKLQFWIPPGFAHGFSILSPEAVFQYKCTNYYSKNSEAGIIFNDPTLSIDWKIDNPKLSEKDLQLKTFDVSKKYFEKEKFI